MPIEILAIITPLGIAFVVLIVRFSGLSKSSRLRDGRNAIDILSRDIAGEKTSGNVIVTRDCRAAFVEMEQPGDLGLVEATGDRFITRLLNSREIISFVVQNDNSVSIRFRDFTHPGGNYEFDTRQEFLTVSGWLNDIKGS